MPSDTVFDAIPAFETLLRLSPRTTLARVRKRAWSTRSIVNVACDLSHATDSLKMSALDVSYHPASVLPPVPSLFPGVRGEDLLTVAAMERTRAADVGEIVLAREGSEIVALHFIHTPADWTRLEQFAPGLYARLCADEVLTESIFVAPACRGRGLASALLRASTSELARRGYRRALAGIDVANIGSLRAFRTAGFTLTGTMRFDRYRSGLRNSQFKGVDAEKLKRYQTMIEDRHLIART